MTETEIFHAEIELVNSDNGYDYYLIFHTQDEDGNNHRHDLLVDDIFHDGIELARLRAGLVETREVITKCYKVINRTSDWNSAASDACNHASRWLKANDK